MVGNISIAVPGGDGELGACFSARSGRLVAGLCFACVAYRLVAK
jgi:hypothetical protein